MDCQNAAAISRHIQQNYERVADRRLNAAIAVQLLEAEFGPHGVPSPTCLEREGLRKRVGRTEFFMVVPRT